ncbi:mechanosensitive ion channel family protein [Achromobacter xylosoxidans]
MLTSWFSGAPADHPIALWLAAVALGVALFLALTLVLRLARSRLERLAQPAGHGAAGAAARGGGRSMILALASLLVAADLTGAPFPGRSGAGHLWFVLAALQLALWLDRGIEVGLSHAVAARGRAGSITATLLSFLLRALVWVIVLLAMLDNVGVNITALVASLGIGGVAVALAVQTILSDLFASISIGLDKPFEAGDFIVFGTVAGSIEHVGLKTTRIRSLGGEQIVCSNTELLKQTIQNYKRMQQRRIVFSIRVTYRTPVDQVAAVPGIIRAQIERQPDTRFDRAHLARMAESALEFEAVYYVMSADYNRYMDLQQAIYLGVMRDLQAAGIALALPESILHLARRPRPAATSVAPTRGRLDQRVSAVQRVSVVPPEPADAPEPGMPPWPVDPVPPWLRGAPRLSEPPSPPSRSAGRSSLAGRGSPCGGSCRAPAPGWVCRDGACAGGRGSSLCLLASGVAAGGAAPPLDCPACARAGPTASVLTAIAAAMISVVFMESLR